MELCSVAPGQRRLKLNEKQTAAMIKIAAQKPWDRSKRISEFVGDTSGLTKDPTVKDFNLQVAPKMMEVSLSFVESLPGGLASSSSADIWFFEICSGLLPTEISFPLHVQMLWKGVLRLGPIAFSDRLTMNVQFCSIHRGLTVQPECLCCGSQRKHLLGPCHICALSDEHWPCQLSGTL